MNGGRGDAASLGLVVCGALAREVERIAAERGWRADLYALPHHLHLHPRRIVEAVAAKLREIAGRHRQLVVAYGDCGTAGALDEVAARHGAVRLPGPHCYEMLAGGDFQRLLEEEPATYFLTDFLLRHWQTTVAAGLDLENRPAMRDAMLGGFRRLLWLRADADPALEAEARRIADSLGLPLAIHQLARDAFGERLSTVIDE